MLDWSGWGTISVKLQHFFLKESLSPSALGSWKTINDHMPEAMVAWDELEVGGAHLQDCIWDRNYPTILADGPNISHNVMTFSKTDEKWHGWEKIEFKQLTEQARKSWNDNWNQYLGSQDLNNEEEPPFEFFYPDYGYEHDRVGQGFFEISPSFYTCKIGIYVCDAYSHTNSLIVFFYANNKWLASTVKRQYGFEYSDESITKIAELVSRNA